MDTTTHCVSPGNKRTTDAPLVSVVICTHDPRPEYLARVLDALRRQTLPLAEWELVIVDNASDPPLAGRLDLAWHPEARLLTERQLGTTVARLHGLRAARGELIVCVDDDNVLGPEYLERALGLAREWPRLGAMGAGKVALEFESAPVAAMQPHLSWLGARDDDVARWSNCARDMASVPAGLGLCVRRDVALEFAAECDSNALARALGRRGRDSLLGEDVLLAVAAHARGVGWGRFPELGLTHLIPAWRLEPRNVMRLIEGAMTSHHIVRYLVSGKVDKPAAVARWGRYVYHNVRWLVRGDRMMRGAFNAARRGHRAAVRLIEAHALAPATINATYATQKERALPAWAPRAPAWRGARPSATRLP